MVELPKEFVQPPGVPGRQSSPWKTLLWRGFLHCRIVRGRGFPSPFRVSGQPKLKESRKMIELPKELAQLPNAHQPNVAEILRVAIVRKVGQVGCPVTPTGLLGSRQGSLKRRPKPNKPAMSSTNWTAKLSKHDAKRP